MKTMISAMLVLSAAILLTACRSGVLFEKTIELPPDGWDQDNFAEFYFPVEDTTSQYHINLIIRNDGRYEFSNLFLFINTTAPGGESIRDTVEIRMSDETGRWLGKGIGGRYTRQVPFKTQVRFPQIGGYNIEVEQGMRKKKLEHITDVGLRIIKTD